jgi:2-oxo-3-hexenedioate decarboxylase
VVGPKLLVDDANRATLAAALPQFPVTLLRDGVFVESGGGANVLGSPVNALAHLRDLLALQPSSPPLAAGEIVTTGTLTDAWPVAVGETWTSRYGMLGIRGQTLSIS